MKYIIFFLLSNLFIFKLQAQTVVGGGHEVPEEVHPKQEQLTLPPFLIVDTYRPREHTGLATNENNESWQLQRIRLIKIFETFNYLKQVDMNCSIKSQQNSMFKGAMTISEIYTRWSTYASLFQMSGGLELLLPSELCQCASPADAFSCLRNDKVLEEMLKTNILNSMTLKEDLNVIHQDLLKRNLTKEKNSNIEYSLKKLILDFYEK